MKKSILSILAVILVAGCVGGQVPWISTSSFVGGNGLTIMEFTVEPVEVYGGSNGKVVMEVENKGGYLVEDGNAFVMIMGSALKIDGDEGDRDMYWTGDADEEQYLSFDKNMRPTDQVSERPADTKRFSWSLDSPEIPAGQIRDDIFIGRVYYDYATDVTGTIWLYSQQEADASRASGRTMRPSSFQSTAGPVAIEVKVSPDPVIIYDDDESFVLTIKLSSVGGGTLYQAGGATIEDESVTDDELYMVDIELDADETWFSWDQSECGMEGDPVTQELVNGRDLTITCDITIDQTPPTFYGVPISVKATYGYYTERTASVTVSGR